MKIPTLPLARGCGIVRTSLLTVVSLFAFAAATTDSQAQTEDDLVGALDPIIQILSDLGVIDPDDPGFPGDYAGLVEEVLAALDEAVLDPLLGDGTPIDPDTFEDLVEAVLGASDDTLTEVSNLLDSETDPALLGPTRELVVYLLDLLLGVGDDAIADLLPGGVIEPVEDLLDQLGAEELIELLFGPDGPLLGSEGLVAQLDDILSNLLDGLLGPLFDGDPAGLTTLITDLIGITQDLLTPELLDPEDPPGGGGSASARGIDLRAGKNFRRNKGDNIYGSFAGQRWKDSHIVRKNFKSRSRFVFLVENDSKRSERPSLKGSKNKRHLRIQYFVAGSNRTGAIRTGRYNDKTLRPGARYVVKVRTQARKKLRKANGSIPKRKATVRMNAVGQHGTSDRAMLKLRTVEK